MVWLLVLIVLVVVAACFMWPQHWAEIVAAVVTGGFALAVVGVAFIALLFLFVGCAACAGA